jgi:hypothetical protein
VRRLIAFSLAWLCAAVVAVVVAWQGVGLVGDQVTSDRPATLSSSQVEAALQGGTIATTVAPDGTSRSTTLTPSLTAAPAAPAPGTAPAVPTNPPPTATPGGGGGGTNGGGGAAPGIAAPGTAAPPAPQAENRTFLVSGGTVELHFAPEGTTLVFATPNAGYQITRNGPADDNGWRVEFEGPAGRSRVEGWWAGGPQVRIDDDAASGGPGGGED